MARNVLIAMYILDSHFQMKYVPIIHGLFFAIIRQCNYEDTYTDASSFTDYE